MWQRTPAHGGPCRWRLQRQACSVPPLQPPPIPTHHAWLVGQVAGPLVQQRRAAAPATASAPPPAIACSNGSCSSSCSCRGSSGWGRGSSSGGSSKAQHFALQCLLRCTSPTRGGGRCHAQLCGTAAAPTARYASKSSGRQAWIDGAAPVSVRVATGASDRPPLAPLPCVLAAAAGG